MKQLEDFIRPLDVLCKEAAAFGHSIDLHAAPNGFASVSFGFTDEGGEVYSVTSLCRDAGCEGYRRTCVNLKAAAHG